MPPFRALGIWTIGSPLASRDFIPLMIDGTPIGSVAFKDEKLVVHIRLKEGERVVTLERITSWKGEVVDDHPEGIWKEFETRDGSARQEISLRRGRRHGKSRKYHLDGSPDSETDYQEGEKHGICRRWDANGEVASEENYEHGKQHGASTVYGMQGEVLGTLIYQDGKPWSGKYVALWEGRSIETGEYSQGKKVGAWMAFDFDGTPLNPHGPRR